MAYSLHTSVSETLSRPHGLPHLPNELRIRILSYVTDPRFLWNVCRWVSPEFKEWAEDQYAREHLPHLKLAVDLIPQTPRLVDMNIGAGNTALTMAHTKSEFLFDYGSLKVNDASIAILPGNDVPWCEYRSTSDAQRRYIRSEDDFDALASPGYTCSSQVMTEIAMGLRPPGQDHVCPCRSIRDQTKRGFCKRYIGANKFFDWNTQDRVLEVKWKCFMAFIYSNPCPAMISSSQHSVV